MRQPGSASASARAASTSLPRWAAAPTPKPSFNTPNVGRAACGTGPGQRRQTTAQADRTCAHPALVAPLLVARRLTEMPAKPGSPCCSRRKDDPPAGQGARCSSCRWAGAFHPDMGRLGVPGLPHRRRLTPGRRGDRRLRPCVRRRCQEGLRVRADRRPAWRSGGAVQPSPYPAHLRMHGTGKQRACLHPPRKTKELQQERFDACSWTGEGCPLDRVTGVGDATAFPKFKVGRASQQGSGCTAAGAPGNHTWRALAWWGKRHAVNHGACIAWRSCAACPSHGTKVCALQVPTPFKASVASKLTFFWKAGDFNAGLAGVSMQVQGAKATQVGGCTGWQGWLAAATVLVQGRCSGGPWPAPAWGLQMGTQPATRDAAGRQPTVGMCLPVGQRVTACTSPCRARLPPAGDPGAAAAGPAGVAGGGAARPWDRP